MVNQGQYYRTDKKCHFMQSQLVCDPHGYIIDIQSGYYSQYQISIVSIKKQNLISNLFFFLQNKSFRGGVNDTVIYRLSALGRGEKPLPDWARILADGGYPREVPLLVPYTRAQAEGNQDRLYANEVQRSYRSLVERTFRRMKVYRVLSRVFCQRKYHLGTVAEVVALLTNKNWRRNRILRGEE